MRYSQPAEIEYPRLDPRPRCTPPIPLSASKLAEAAGVEKQWFKSNVRKLKKLGLTEIPGSLKSDLEPAYRIVLSNPMIDRWDQFVSSLVEFAT